MQSLIGVNVTQLLLVTVFIGFVFWRPSKRYISPEKAIKLKQMLLPKIKAVGVFVDEDVKVIADY